MDLRDYQNGAIDKLRASLGAGNKRPVIQAPTGSGKTVIAAALVRMAREKGKNVIFTVPAISLIDQTVERFAQNGILSVGVMQGAHELTDIDQPVQVCSVQTLARRKIPQADLVIVDECHVRFKLYDQWMNDPAWASVPFVGLTATPWAKGMGSAGRWDDLIVATTTDELIKNGSLSDFKVFAPAHPDLSGVKTVAGDYDLSGLNSVMDKSALVADIVSTWLQRGENRQTICFAVSRVHAKHISDQFVAAGVGSEYMDAFTDNSDRREIFDRFKSGQTKIICNVGVLTTGFDADVRCIILARPTKSEILYTQMIGRGLRTAEGKDHCLVLDHSDTTLRLGFVTDIKHDKLDDGRASVAEKKKPERLPKECSACSFVKPIGAKKCPACGFEPTATSSVEVEDGELHEITRGKKQKIEAYDFKAKRQFYAEVALHAKLRGYKEGWAYWAYKDKFKESPERYLVFSSEKNPAQMISPETEAWIRYRNIRKAKANEKYKKVASA
jgi:superfamily II DNA or RNA helicase